MCEKRVTESVYHDFDCPLCTHWALLPSQSLTASFNDDEKGVGSPESSLISVLSDKMEDTPLDSEEKPHMMSPEIKEYKCTKPQAQRTPIAESMLRGMKKWLYERITSRYLQGNSRIKLDLKTNYPTK